MSAWTIVEVYGSNIGLYFLKKFNIKWCHFGSFQNYYVFDLTDVNKSLTVDIRCACLAWSTKVCDLSDNLPKVEVFIGQNLKVED